MHATLDGCSGATAMEKEREVQTIRTHMLHTVEGGVDSERKQKQKANS
jgi:hypothetical protein